MPPTYRGVDDLRREFASKEPEIRGRLDDFRRVGRRSDRDLFHELCFCVLAIQTKARGSDAAVRGLVREKLLWSADERSIARWLRHRVRFHNHKASYLVRARDRFFADGRPALRAALDRLGSPEAARAWLVDEVDGLGMKEASHFLRNIGRGEDLAILDRHVLRNLVRHRVIGRVPTTLTPRRYVAIEARVRRFADHVGVSVAALDLLLWSRETGEIFK
ncbi:MAG: N-glycosylase/DNA lyase [Methanobacteriota archaeon]